MASPELLRSVFSLYYEFFYLKICLCLVTVLLLYISKIKQTMVCQTVNKLNAKLLGKAKYFRSFESPPKPSEAKLEEASWEFYHGILSSLRAKSLSPVYVKMNLDLWWYVSFNRGAESQHAGYWLYQIEDFSRFDKPPQNWWYFFEQGW